MNVGASFRADSFEFFKCSDIHLKLTLRKWLINSKYFQ